MICSVEDCTDGVKARGWCGKHYARWLRYGDLNFNALPARGMPPVDRIALYVNAEGDCWLWSGARDDTGYGDVTYQGKSWKAHRWVWSVMVGPIPEGMTIDHLCRVRHCVNPDHLEVVTQGVNTLRGYGPAGRHARTRECPKGHPYDAENTYRFPDGRRDCRTCRAASRRRYKERQTAR